MYRSAEVTTEAFWSAEPWQRTLFEEICMPVRGQLIKQFIETPPEQLPFKRLFLFGITYLPPLMLDLLKAVSEHIDVCFFLTGPEFGQQSSRLAGIWGCETAEFALQLRAYADDVNVVPANHSSSSMLHDLQCSLSGELFSPGEPDDSLQVVSCHSPRREVEVLLQYLLRLFEEYPALEPEDVLISAPDVELYATHLQAVFLHASEHKLPLQRMGGYSGDQSVGRLVLDILDWPCQRLTVSDLLGLCGIRIIQQTFGLEPDDLVVIGELLKESRYYWAVSGRDKADRFGLPATESHSLTQALSRMVLGIALDDGDAVYGDQILPLAGMTGKRASVAAGLWSLGDAVEKTMEEASVFEQLDSVGKVGFVRNILNRFVEETEETAVELAAIDGELCRLQERLTDQVSLPVMRAALGVALTEQRNRQSASLTGGVVVCPLNDIANVPFKVVALLGLNEGDFPSKDPLLSFNLMGTVIKAGDRSRANGGLAVFFQRIQSTKSHLILSYCGGSLHRVESYPPAVPLAELIDWVQEKIAPDFRVMAHPMQPFSPQYFTGTNGLFSYAGKDLCLAEKVRSGKSRELLRFEDPIASVVATSVEISPQELCDFLVDSSTYFIRQVMRVRLPGQEDDLPTVEPFDADHLSLYMVRQKVMNGLLRGEGELGLINSILADGVLPDGDAGADCLEGAILPDCRILINELVQEPPPDANLLFANVALKGGVIRGTVNKLHDDHLLWWRPGSLKPKYLLGEWVRHLLAMCSGIDAPTRLYGVGNEEVEKKQFNVLSPADAKACLQRIFDAYLEGLIKPVPLFPKTAWAYAESEDKEKGHAVWEDNYKFGGENADGLNPFIYKSRLPERWSVLADEIVKDVMNNLRDLNEAV